MIERPRIHPAYRLVTLAADVDLGSEALRMAVDGADDGTLLRKFGDPRRVGAELPLWVLVSADGKIAHYKVGFYDIKPDEGLKQLDAEVVKLIRQQRASNKKN